MEGYFCVFGALTSYQVGGLHVSHSVGGFPLCGQIPPLGRGAVLWRPRLAVRFCCLRGWVPVRGSPSKTDVQSVGPVFFDEVRGSRSSV